MAPRPIVENVVRRLVGAQGGWADAGVEEFLRAYLSPRGRAAFYAAARNIYLDEPHGENGFWTRIEELAPSSLFVWGRQDRLVPIAFMKHVEKALRRPRTWSSSAATCPSSRRRARRTRPSTASSADHATLDLRARARYNLSMDSHPPGPRIHRMAQGMMVTARPYGWMRAAAPLRRRLHSHFPIFGRVVYVADPADIKRVFAGDPAVSTRARRTPSPWATRSATTRCSRSTRGAT